MASDRIDRYVGFGEADEARLRALVLLVQHELPHLATLLADQLLAEEGARELGAGAGRLQQLLAAWIAALLDGRPSAESAAAEDALRAVVPAPHLFGATSQLRRELHAIAARVLGEDERAQLRDPLDRRLDLSLAVLLDVERASPKGAPGRLAGLGQLVASVAHELRNPLGVIDSSLHLLSARVDRSDERVRKHLDRIAAQVRRSSEIIAAVLDLARDRPPTRDLVALPGLVAEIVAEAEPPAGVHIIVIGLAELPSLHADPRQLRQALRNVLDNAIHAASPAGEVRLVGERHGDAVELAIEDSGPGVDDATLAHLFEPLVTTKVGGVGLGLALVRRLVEHHGGDIRYTRAASGGARFVLRLPINPRSPDEARTEIR